MHLPIVTLATSLSLAVGAAAFAQQSYVDRMAHEHRNDAPVATEQTETPPAQPVTAGPVTYATVDGTAVKGYLARPEKGAGPYPGIIVIHEWWGLNDNIRAMTRELAGEGYAALAVDLYGGRSATTPEEARTLMTAALDRRAANDENLRQAYAFLHDHEKAPRVGVVGWCFGGGYSLQAAILLPGKIDACVIYYGHLETAEDALRHITAPILGLFGGEDQGIPVESVHAFAAAMTKLGKRPEIHIYPGASHAFANPSGTRYEPKAAKDAWQRTLAFFAAHLKRSGA